MRLRRGAHAGLEALENHYGGALSAQELQRFVTVYRLLCYVLQVRSGVLFAN